MSEISNNCLEASILVVDDSSANILLMERMLEGAGYTDVDSCEDPREVKGLFEKKRFDLLILDLNMPHMDGFEVMEMLFAMEGIEMPPILVLTAQHAAEFRVRALDMGASDYLTKPFNRLELLARARNLIDVCLAHRFMRDQNEILNRKVQERTEELYATRLQVVQRLGLAAEYRDNETGLHIIRMSKMSAMIGKEAGMSEKECELLLNASPMHDIGKIGIPDHILQKPGKLDAGEWETMMTHAQIGADILSGDDSDLMKMAHTIALTHHEKWDGSGYPNGLKGQDIPLVGRIVALADVFDALTSERPYKEAWPVEKAVDLIREQSGKHFDPELVVYFLDILPSLVDISEQYAEPDAAAS